MDLTLKEFSSPHRHGSRPLGPLKDQLIGTWILASNIMERPDGTKTEQFGPTPKGILIFASDGHFATVNARADLPKLASANRSRATPEETKAVVEGSLAYYDAYSVSDSEKLITVHEPDHFHNVR